MSGKIVSFEIRVIVHSSPKKKEWRIPELGPKSAAKALGALIMELEKCGDGTATFFSDTTYVDGKSGVVAFRNQRTPAPLADVIATLREFALELKRTPEITL